MKQRRCAGRVPAVALAGTGRQKAFHPLAERTRIAGPGVGFVPAAALAGTGRQRAFHPLAERTRIAGALLVHVGIMLVAVTGSGISVSLQPAHAQEKKQKDKSKKEVAGKADVLRHVPKRFARLISVDPENRRVRLQPEEEEQSRTWSVAPDAELKVHGWWGRLNDFTVGDRVWVWFAVDRNKQPTQVLMLADELSEQDIHGLPHTLKSLDVQDRTLTVESAISGKRTLRLGGKEAGSDLVGKKVFVQTAGKSARIVASEERFEQMRRQQQERLREQWRERGLPGTVVFLHPLAGEMDLMLDHEAIRWGRYLKPGEEVTILGTAEAIRATVKQVRPWRERTQLRLVTRSGLDQTELSLGQRVGLQVPEPPAEVQASQLPTDIGRRTSKEERTAWFLTAVYCSCKVAGDRCTGMFYTQASCNVNACGMPNSVRRQVGELIEGGMTDEQIWEALRDQRGPSITRPHLLH